MYDWSSFVGGGQRFAINARVGFETQDASISWVDPWFLHRKLAFGTEIFYSNSTYFSDYYDQQNYGFAISLRKPIGELDYVKLEYRLEQYRIDAEGTPLSSSGNRTETTCAAMWNFPTPLIPATRRFFPRKGGKLKCWPVIPAWAAMCIHTISA